MELTDLFYSFKNVDDPAPTIKVYNPTAVSELVINQGNLTTRVSNLKQRLEESPVFKGWKSGGNHDKPIRVPYAVESTKVSLTSQNTQPTRANLGQGKTTSDFEMDKQSYLALHPEHKDTVDFLTSIVGRESFGGKKDAINSKTGAAGYFQMMDYNIKEFYPNGRDNFLKDGIGQFSAAVNYSNKQWSSLSDAYKNKAKKLGLTDRDIRAGMWHSGVSGFKKWLDGQKGRGDGNMTTSAYINDTKLKKQTN